ncbi:hypothetical protein C0J52_00398 [Blattella germanica]|nr:hypothetical protein C0J52_00398 [Blattella germanica]
MDKYEKVKKDVASLIEDSLKKFQIIWEECGFTEDSKKARCEALTKHVKGLLEEMYEEEQGNKNYLINKIEEYLKEANVLNKDLCVEIPLTGYEHLPLYEVEHSLRKQLEVYRKIKEQRLSTFSELRKKEKELCDDLGVPMQEVIFNVPSEQQLEDFKKHVLDMTIEKTKLFASFRETKASIIEIMETLEVCPELDFEKHVVCDDDNSFKVTKENMAMLRKLHQRLQAQLEDATAEAAELREKLSGLWERLHEDFAVRDSFLKANKGHSTSTINALKKELRRCEELKRQNIQKFVQEIRRELVHWWDRCFVHCDERALFLPYSSECYTEDLLDLHELEVRKYRDFYQENMEELEEKASDPERLFHNRGGQLLLEEKERKRIQKELPKVEKELLKHVSAFETKHGQPIKIFGECIRTIIENKWLEHNYKKENQKKVKKSSSKRKIINGTSTPVPKLPMKRRRVGAENKGFATPYLPVQRNIFPESVSSNTNMTTYTDFQDHLEAVDKAGTCRSSVVPERCLRERNTPAKTPSKIPSRVTKTPQSSRITPAKPPRKVAATNPPKTPRSLRDMLSYQKGSTTAPRLTTPRGRLPIII